MFTLKDACKYSLVPHRLGFCGPNEDCSETFLNYIEGRSSNIAEIKEILKKFKPVYYYCKRIAKSNGTKDPMDERVLEAYWIGNDLLRKARYKNGGYLHHSYHVWQRKPFNPDIKLTDRMKRICQISVRRVGNNYYAYHWKERIQRLNKEQVENLKYYTKANKCLSKN